MPKDYPIYYEDAAHIARILTDNGLRLNWFFPAHHLLLCVAWELEKFVTSSPSHAEAGARLVRLLCTDPIDDARRQRLDAIAGTLVGNFLLTRRRPAHAQR